MPHPLTYDELIKELTLSDNDALLVYGSIDPSVRKISDSLTDLIATILVASDATAEDIYKLSLGVCDDEKSKLYLLLISPVIGSMSTEQFGEIQNGSLAVVDFDHLIKRLRERMVVTGRFAQQLLQRK